MAPKSVPVTTVRLAGNLEAGDLALYRKDLNVKVGDAWSHALIVFPEPARGAYEIHDLPYSFSDSEKFEAHGWETAKGEGFGVISVDTKTVGAIYEIEHARQDVIDDLLRQEISGMYPAHPKLTVSGPLQYWFWTTRDQVAMMCSFATKDGINFTMAMGDKNIMKALSVSEEDAKKQIVEIQRIESQSPK